MTTQTRTYYIAADGREFTDEPECLQYEADALNWEEHSGELPNEHVKYRDCTERNFIRAGRETGLNTDANPHSK